MPTSLIQLQQRMAQVGRIRLGEKVPTSGGKSRPKKLETFRLTSKDRTVIEEAARIYGGEPREWEREWEVVTTATALNIALVPDRSISQAYELWGKASPRAKDVTCLRRCDGDTEMLSGGACLCGDPAECKLTTRLSVILRDVRTLGLWRLDTHSYYAAVELPASAQLIEQLAMISGGRPIPARLRVEARERHTEEGRRYFQVPVLDVDVSLDQIYASTGALEGGTEGQRSLASTVTDARPVAVLTAGEVSPETRSSIDEAHEAMEARRTEAPKRGPRSAEPVGGRTVRPRSEPLPEEQDEETPVKASGRAPIVPEADDEARKKRCQRIAISANEIGVDHHDVVEAFTEGRTRSSKEVTADEFPTLMATFVQLKRGKVELRDTGSGIRLVNVDLGIVHSPNPATAEAILEDDATTHDDAVAVIEEAFDGVEVDPVTGEEIEEAEVVTDEVWSAAQWKEWAPKGVGQATMLRTARSFAQERGESPPTSLDEISAAVGADVRAQLGGS